MRKRQCGDIECPRVARSEACSRRTGKDTAMLLTGIVFWKRAIFCAFISLVLVVSLLPAVSLAQEDTLVPGAESEQASSLAESSYEQPTKEVLSAVSETEEVSSLEDSFQGPENPLVQEEGARTKEGDQIQTTEGTASPENSPSFKGREISLVTDFAGLQNALAVAASGSTIEIGASFDITEKLTVPEGKILTITSGQGEPFVLTRSAVPAYTGTLVELATGASLSLVNVTLDGGGSSIPSVTGSIVLATEASSLSVGTGATLRNNIKTSGSGGAVLTSGLDINLVFNSGCLIDANQVTAGQASGGAVSASSYAGSTTESVVITVNGGTFSNNKAASGGGAFSLGQADSIVINDGQIIKNESKGYFGGGISSYGNLEIHGGLISQNAANRGGGGISVQAGNCSSLTMTGGTVSYNNGGYYSGGVHIGVGFFQAYPSKGAISVTGGLIEQNTGVLGGGVSIVHYGAYGETSTKSVAIGGDVKITKNTATNSAGGIYVGLEQGNATIMDMEPIIITDNVEVSYNQAPSVGGIYSSSSKTKPGKNLEVLISGRVSVHHNEATTGSGGGIYTSGHGLTISDDVKIVNNKANTLNAGGGGLFVSERTTIDKQETIVNIKDRVTISDNSARNGGGLYAGNDAEVYLSGTAAIKDNIGNLGAGMYVYAAQVKLSGESSVEGNRASFVGGSSRIAGAAYVGGDSVAGIEGRVTLEDACRITNNSADVHVGGVYVDVAGTLSLTDNSLVSDNSIVDTAGLARAIYLQVGGGSLEASGTPQIGISADDNGVYLSTGTFVSIPIGKSLASGANINIEALSAGPSVGALVAKRADGVASSSDEALYFSYLQNRDFKVIRDASDPSTYVLQTAYTVTFLDWDGSSLAIQRVAEGYGAIAPSLPLRVGSHLYRMGCKL